MLQRMLCLMMLVLPVIVVQAQVAQDDSLALVALYQATDGASWSDTTNWLTGPVAQWYGVTVTEDRVTHLDLNANGLAGEIPVELANLTGFHAVWEYGGVGGEGMTNGEGTDSTFDIPSPPIPPYSHTA